MKLSKFFILFFSLLASLTVISTANKCYGANPLSPPQPQRTQPEELTLEAQQVLLMDAATGTILYEKNADMLMHPSSMSKIVTAYMVFEKLKKGELTLSTKFPVSEKAWRMQGSKMFVGLGTQISVEDLLRGIVVQSGNDACIVVAEALGGTEENFARQMTQKARDLGMKNSNFVNSHGWEDPNHLTTARDLAIVAQRTIEDFPEYYSYYKEIDFTYNNIKQGNRNPLLYDNFGADGLKTGHTDEGGFGLVASAVQNGRRLILVINGCSSVKTRSQDAKTLLTWGFRAFDNVTFAKAGQIMENAPVSMGKQPTVGLVSPKNVVVTVRGENKDKVKAEVSVPSPLVAPLQKDQQAGYLKITFPDGTQKDFPLVTDQAIEELGFFGKLWAKAKNIF